jgi:hypothetical protein
MVIFKVLPAAAVLGETEIKDWALTENPIINNKYVNRFFIGFNITNSNIRNLDVTL